MDHVLPPAEKALEFELGSGGFSGAFGPAPPRVFRAEDVVVLQPFGALDRRGAAALREAFTRIPGELPAMVEFDLRFVPWIDGEGLGALLFAQRCLTFAGRSLALRHCGESVRSVLHLSRVEALIPVLP